MSMPSIKDQVVNFRSEMKNSLSDIFSAYKKGDWATINSLTALFPNTPYSLGGYISPSIKVPTNLDILINKISYMTQTNKTIKDNLNKLNKILFPSLVKEAHNEKLM